MVWLWIAVGGFVGLVHGITQIRLVAQIRPGADFDLRGRVFRSYGLRFGLSVAVLALAAQHGIVPILGVFFSLWLIRWITVWVGHTGVIDWSRFDLSSRGVE